MEQNKRTQTARKAPPQKKKMSKKSKWRRRKRIAIVCLPFVALILLVVLFIGTIASAEIENYTVSGTKKYTAEQVWAASGLEKGKSMFFSSLGEAEENITVKLPYIESAKIKRKIPDTITITVVQSKAELALQMGNEWLLVNSSGKVMENLGTKQPEAKVMQLKLPKAKKYELGQVIEFELKEDELSPIDVCKDLLSQVEKTELKGKITSVDITDPEDVTLVYDGRIRLHIGMPTDLSSKLGLAAGAVKHEDAINPKQTGEINLTVLQEAYFRPDKKDKTEQKDAEKSETEQTTDKSN